MNSPGGAAGCSPCSASAGPGWRTPRRTPSGGGPPGGSSRRSSGWQAQTAEAARLLGAVGTTGDDGAWEEFEARTGLVVPGGTRTVVDPGMDPAALVRYLTARQRGAMATPASLVVVARSCWCSHCCLPPCSSSLPDASTAAGAVVARPRRVAAVTDRTHHHPFQRLAAGVLDELLERHPESGHRAWATTGSTTGSTTSPGRAAEEVTWAGQPARRPRRGWTTAGPGRRERVDAEILRNALQCGRWSSSSCASTSGTPWCANPGTAVYTLLARDFAPLGERLRSAAGRLAGVPERLEQARGAARRDAPGARRDGDRAVHRDPDAARDRARARAGRGAGAARPRSNRLGTPRSPRWTSTSTWLRSPARGRRPRPPPRRRALLPQARR